MARDRQLMAHYMPWFEADPSHNRWGWHWTMNHYDPGHLVSGRRDAASRYYPLIGLYDSNDPAALERHVLMMKLAGIDRRIEGGHASVSLSSGAIRVRSGCHPRRG